MQGLDEGIITEERVEEAWKRIQKYKQLIKIDNGKQ